MRGLRLKSNTGIRSILTERDERGEGGMSRTNGRGEVTAQVAG
jgi:hypothetical protein